MKDKTDERGRIMEHESIYENEVWQEAPLPGYERYLVSDMGRIMNADTGKVLQAHDNGAGYDVVVLSKDGKGRLMLVSRLVALTFIPNPDQLEQVDHVNADRKDNRADNLQWLSRKDNNRKRLLTEEDRARMSETTKKQHAEGRCKANKVECVETGETFKSQYKAAKWAGCSDVTLSKALKKG